MPPSRRKPTNFYSVILSGDVNKTSIRIPNRFIRGHRKQILSHDVVLIVSDDKVWHSGWTVSGDGKLWLQKGWPEFARHYRIRYGHLLLFKHLGKSVFHVTIFDSSNCEIDYPIETPKLKKEIDQSVALDDEIEGGDTDDVFPKKPVIKEETNDDDLSENVQYSMTRAIKRSHIYKMPMKKSFVKAVGINGYRSLRLKNDDGKVWKVEVRKYAKEKILYVGWFDFRKDNKMEIGDLCEFNHVKDNLIHVRVLKKQNRWQKGSRNTPKKKSFAKAVGINGYRSMRLKNDDGKMWEVKVRKYAEEKMLYITWSNFRKDNKLQIGGSCEFNHVKDNLLHVQLSMPVHALKKWNQ